MTVYAVFAPSRDRSEDAMPRLVPEKFSWSAFWLPPAYFLGHGLWLAFAGYSIGVLALAALALVWGGAASVMLYGLLAFWIGTDAPALRRGALRRKGFSHQTDLVAASVELAQLEWLKGKGAR